VVVGGTTYYLEPLLFKTTDAPTSQFTDISTENPLEQLKAIDPLAAEKFHEHDIRRISNALRYHKSTGQLPSEIPDFHSAECTLLLDDVLILWPKWEKKEMLREKVRSRIHSMLHVEGGL
jgi:tRNA dimethylallyltransferase